MLVPGLRLIDSFLLGQPPSPSHQQGTGDADAALTYGGYQHAGLLANPLAALGRFSPSLRSLFATHGPS